MDSHIDDMTTRENEYASGANSAITIETGTQSLTGTVVTFTTAGTASVEMPPEVHVPITVTNLNAPAIQFKPSGVNSLSSQNYNVSSQSEFPLGFPQTSHLHLTNKASQETANRFGYIPSLHSTMLNNIVEGNGTANIFSSQNRLQQSQSSYPVDVFTPRRNSSWHNYTTRIHSAANMNPTWSSQMPMLYNGVQFQPDQNSLSSSVTQHDSRYAHTAHNGWSAYTPSTSLYNAQNFAMPSPISHSMASPIGVTSYTHANSTAPFTHTSFPNRSSAVPDITLSSSQIASRQVVTKDLPNFSGLPEEWPLFITNYMQSTERCGFTDQENLLRLQKCLKGDALKAVRGQLMMPSTVSCAIETLKMLFGRADVIHQTMQCKLRQEPPVKSDKLESLIQFALSVQNYCATIQAIGLVDYLYDPMLLAVLVSKLPGELKLDWGRHQMQFARVDIGAFARWLFALATCASQVTSIGHSLHDTNSEVKNSTRQPKQRIMLHEVVEQKGTSTKEQASCRKCNEDHRLADCSRFCDLSSKERWMFVREEGLCFRCFKKHQVRRCNLKKQCGVDGCEMSHHALLHATSNEQDNQGSGVKMEAGVSARIVKDPVVFFHSKDQKKALFRYVPVKLLNGGKSMDTYALIDEGSACTLIESSIATELELQGPTAELCLRWTGDITQSETNSKVVSLDVSSRDINARRFNLNNVRTVSSLDLPVQSLDACVLAERPHLRNLPISSYCDAQARILIGLDNAKIGVPLETREAEDDDLVATRCKLGWAVYGRNGDSSGASQSVLHICPCSSTEKMDIMLKAYFSLESVGVGVTFKTLESKEDERARRIMNTSSKYHPAEKRWETGLLWKYNTIDLPNSLPMAKRRLQCLESKMRRDPDLANFLKETIRNYEENGYVRKMERNEISSGGKSWYIPFFTVTNEHKKKKRLVWDAAAMVNDVSLNTVLMKGPDLLASLVGVLIRFREKPVALCGDIKEMFHQVIVRKEDQVAQKFLWREGDTSREPDVFVMQVMTFGTSCSPTLANYIKNRNAYRWEEHHPKEVHSIVRNTYVDDWLQSVETEEEMIQIATTVRNIHRDGGFEMRNWSSNSERVLAALSGSTLQVDKRIDEFDVMQEKVLGLWWLPQTDELTYIQSFDKTVFDERLFPTKRQILRVVMTVFDPLGLLGFYVVQAKVILQNIWRSGVTWDEPVRDEEREEWWQWTRRLPLIGTIKIPRCYALPCDDIELHTFVDASINAYAAVSYLRSGRDGKYLSSLVASKTRVAPLKPVSIPRLELMAAILGLRLAKYIEGEISISIRRRLFWTDSRNVLYWIRYDARKFHQFVALRIGEILEGSDVNEWRWVPTAENVADEGTKPTKSSGFDRQSRWFTGPKFLTLSECDWPELRLDKPTDFDNEIVYHMAVQTKLVSALAVISPDPNRFSKWEKLRNAQRYVLEYLSRLLTQKTKSEITKLLLNARGIEGAEAVIIRVCQEEVFYKELTCLRSGGTVSRYSSIFRCSPYCDEFGILRVQGRVDVVPGVESSVKRPIIMPRNHSVTRLLTDFYHRKFHHHHNEIVVNEMRQRFYISGIRVLVRTVAKNCQLCRNRRASPFPPTMGSLPPERIAPFTAPFTYTGVDYFGPIDIVVGRRREKRWGVLFTCLTTRAAHIEVAPSLSTESFLLVLKQFISRRGVPRRNLSDNGTNFRGASRVLAEEIEKVSSGQLKQEHPEIEWRFIPPASPHMGGAWERMIRSVKSIMMDILQETALREDVLRDPLADIENILNCRPLTYVPLDSPESEALTPNHFLFGSSSGVRERGSEDGGGVTLRKNFNLTNQLANQFWKRWVREYLPSLTRRTKWFQPPLDPIALNDVVIIVDENSKRNTWSKGIVVDLHRSRDMEARSAVVKTVNGLVTRPIIKLAKLDVKRVNITQVEDAEYLQRGECCDKNLAAPLGYVSEHTPK